MTATVTRHPSAQNFALRHMPNALVRLMRACEAVRPFIGLAPVADQFAFAAQLRAARALLEHYARLMGDTGEMQP